MSFIIFFLVTLIIALCLFYKCMISAFPTARDNAVSIAEMERCENDIRLNFQNYVDDYRNTANIAGNDDLNVHQLAEFLGLKVEKADMSNAMRGMLVPAESRQYYGIIRIPEGMKKKYSEEFDIIHEIVHYIRDVGVGKRVSTSYARTSHGNYRSHKEQVVDYYAAAIAIPADSLRKRLYLHDGDPYDALFVSELVEVYKQPKETIKRRIAEVIALS